MNDFTGDLGVLFKQRVQWLQEHHYSKRTIGDTQSALEKFRRWSVSQQIISAAQINKEVLESWQTWTKNQRGKHAGGRPGVPWSIVYQYDLLSEVIRCLQWAYRRGYILIDPTSGIHRPKLPKTLPKNLLSLKQLEELLRLPDLDKPSGLRDRAVLEVFYATAIRCGELLNLRPQDLDRREELIIIKEGKGRKDRVLPISLRALKWAGHYELEVRERWRLKGLAGDALFLSERGTPLSQSRCIAMVKGYLQKVAPDTDGPLGKGSTHLLRHSVATILLEQGCDIRYIQEFLGHERIDTTQIYTKVSPTHLSKMYQKFHPGA